MTGTRADKAEGEKGMLLHHLLSQGHTLPLKFSNRTLQLVGHALYRVGSVSFSIVGVLVLMGDNNDSLNSDGPKVSRVTRLDLTCDSCLSCKLHYFLCGDLLHLLLYVMLIFFVCVHVIFVVVTCLFML